MIPVVGSREGMGSFHFFAMAMNDPTIEQGLGIM